MPDVFRFEQIVSGQLASKSNSRKIVMLGRGDFKRPAVIKSEEARRFVTRFLAQVPRRATSYTGPVTLKVLVYYPNLLTDLDIALLADCLQNGTPRHPMANIIKNDRQVWKIKTERVIDKDNPRVHLVLEPFTPSASPAEFFKEPS